VLGTRANLLQVLTLEQEMTTIKHLFHKHPSQVTKRYLERAFNLQKQLSYGTNYRDLVGRRLVLQRELVRFKFGYYRLIFKMTKKEITPYIPMIIENTLFSNKTVDF